MGLVPFFTVRKWREVALRLPPAPADAERSRGPAWGAQLARWCAPSRPWGGGSEPLGPSQGRWRSKQGWADSSWDPLPSRRLSSRRDQRGAGKRCHPPQSPRKALTPGRSGHPSGARPGIAASPVSVSPLTVLVLRDHHACHQSLQPRYPRRVRFTGACRAHRTGNLVPPWHMPDSG